VTVTDLDWEQRWFYVPNNERLPLPTFSHNRLHPDTPESWSWTPSLSEPEHLCLLLDAINDLKNRGLTAPRVIRTFFSCRVLPLQMRGHSQWEFQGTMDPIRVEEVDTLMMTTIGWSTQDPGDGEDPDAFHASNPPPTDRQTSHWCGL
jgi:hypothetical protein